METRRHGDKDPWRYGDIETWRHGHGDMETWRHGDIDGDIETCRYGDMEFLKNKIENGSPDDYPLFVYCLLIVQTEVYRLSIC